MASRVGIGMKCNLKEEIMQPAKVNRRATIISGVCEGLSGIVVSAEAKSDKVLVGIVVDSYTLIETTSDNIKQDNSHNTEKANL